MQCAAHADVETEVACVTCGKGICETCAVYEIDGADACEACGRAADDKSRAIGSALLVLVSVGYLATIAVCVAIWKPRPFIGGLAAVVSIAVGRALQVVLRPRAVTRRAPSAQRLA